MTALVKKPQAVIDFGDFVQGYIVAALWSSMDNYDDSGGSPLDENYCIDDIHPDTRKQMDEDCRDFFDAQAKDLAEYAERMGDHPEYTAWARAGHDFWLTRNGHGAGFWDRGLGDLGDRLADAARVYKGVDLYVGDDGKVHE